MPDLPPGSPMEEFFDEFFKNRAAAQGDDQDQAERRRAGSIRSAPASSSIRPGIVVTNNHVIADADEITVILNDGTKLQGRTGRQGHQERSRAAAGASRQAAQGGEVRRLRQAAARRMGDRDRQSVQPRRHGDRRHRLGAQPRHQFRALRQLHPDRRRHQSRQFRRPAVQPRRRGDRHQHRDHLAVRRLDRHRLCGAVRRRRSPSSTSFANSARRAAAGSACASSRSPTTSPKASSIKPPHGALVAGVDDKGPAKPAGIEPGDVIVKFDGHDVKEMHDLPRIVADTPVGKEVDVVVIRKGKEETHKVKIGRLEDGEKLARADAKKDAAPAEKSVVQKTLGLELSSLSDDLRKKFKIRDNVKGVLVTGVDPNVASAARQAALRRRRHRRGAVAARRQSRRPAEARRPAQEGRQQVGAAARSPTRTARRASSR